ncbi:LysE family translocator [Nocardiopsis kunsanensis]|nr:LysE family translocator [Nocardiopsis kunsanensis]
MVGELLVAAGMLAVVTMAPGPDMAVVTRQVVSGGRGDGLRTTLGIILGLCMWGALTALGLSALLAASPTAFTVVTYAGAAYLVHLGVRSFLDSRHRDEAPADAAPPRGGNAWTVGLISNVLNPKIAVFYIGLLPTLAPSALPTQWGMALLVAAHLVLTALWLGGYVLVLDAAKHFFARPAVRRWMDRIMGSVLVVFGVRVAVNSP